MAYRTAQSNFSRGEIGEELLGRFDIPTYNTGLKQAYNVIILKYGGVTKRPGTRIVAEVKDDSEPVWLISFQFSIDQGYALEFGQAYMRPLANGGVVVESELAITGITNANPGVVSAAFHGYSAGNQVTIIGQAGMDEINGRVVTILATPTAGTFTIDLDTTHFGVWTGNTGGATNVSPPPPPPPPPPVPTPPPPPEPPPVYGGGSGRYCVTSDTMILLANMEEMPARDLTPGTMLQTIHEESRLWGNYPVKSIEFETRPVFTATINNRVLRATADHRIWMAHHWVRMEEIGIADGEAEVALITVEDAHTYIANGVLSHNIKSIELP